MIPKAASSRRVSSGPSWSTYVIREREFGLLRPRRYPLPRDEVHQAQPGNEHFHEWIGRSRGGNHPSLSFVALGAMERLAQEGGGLHDGRLEVTRYWKALLSRGLSAWRPA